LFRALPTTLFKQHFSMLLVSMQMKKGTLFIALLLLLFGCGRKRAVPDVSQIQVELKWQHFEQDFFAIDTNAIVPAIARLRQQYPVFADDFLRNILGLPPLDSVPEANGAIRQFLSSYRAIKDSADKVFSNVQPIQDEVKRGLQFLKYYFPEYHAPTRLISFIGPMDAYYEGSLGGYGDIITGDALAVGLQLHLGKNFSLYTSEMGQGLYPSYISSRFEPAYIPVNCMKNCIDDLFPEHNRGKSLLDQMVDKGKRLYVLDMLLPTTADSLKIGYTGSQLEDCYKNEGLIWNFYLQNNLLYDTDPDRIKNYVGDGPKTDELGEGSPGFIVLFSGWQMVKKYMDTHPEVSLKELMNKDGRSILNDSHYKPK